MRPLAYHRPNTLEEAWRLRAKDAGARFVAGGTDLMAGGALPRTLVSLRAIPGLDGLDLDAGGGLRIGALTRVSDLMAHAAAAKRYPALVAACRLFGSPQIRNAATVGGNLCNASPAADLAPPLLVAEARVSLRGPQGAREMALHEFLAAPGETALAPGEILTDVRLEAPAPGARAVFFRKTRVRMDLALASVVVSLAREGDRCRQARVAAGAVAPTALRLEAVEALLEGERLTPELAARAGELAARSVRPIDDLRTTANYRRRIVGVYVKRAVETLAGREPR